MSLASCGTSVWELRVRLCTKGEQALSRKLRKEDNIDIVNELRDESTNSGGDEDDLGELQEQIEAIEASSERWRCPYCPDDTKTQTYIDHSGDIFDSPSGEDDVDTYLAAAKASC